MEWTVEKQDAGCLLSEYLKKQVDDVPEKVISEVIRTRNVKIDSDRVSKDLSLQAGQKLTVYWPKAYLKKIQADTLPVVYRDEHLLIVNKPYGLISQSATEQRTGNNAEDIVHAMAEREGWKAECVKLCHRLDVMTGGLLMFALDEESYESAVVAFSDRSIDKQYVCEVKGTPAQASAELHAWLRKDEKAASVSITDYPANGALPIETHYEVIEPGITSLLRVDLITGRTHQIRAHLAHIGHPIIGDDKYGDRLLNREIGARHQRLWATKMTFHAEGALSYMEGKAIEVPYPYEKYGK